MKDQIFIELAEMLNLKDNAEYQKYAQNESLTEEEKLKMASIISDAMESNVIITGNATDSELSIVKGRYEALSNSDTNKYAFETYVYTAHEIANIAYKRYTVSALLDKLEDTARRMGVSTITNILKNVTADASFEEQKKALISTLRELELYVRAEVIKAYDKKLTDAAKTHLDMLAGQCSDITSKLEDDKSNSAFALRNGRVYIDNAEKILKKHTNVKVENKKEDKSDNAIIIHNGNSILVREQKSGKTEAPIKKPIAWKEMVIGGLVVLVAVAAIYGGSKVATSIKIKNDSKTNTEASDTVEQETNTIETITTEQGTNTIETITTPTDSSKTDEAVDDEATIALTAKKVHENWSSLGLEYNEEDIIELCKLLNGIESSIDWDTADEMLVTVLDKATVEASNRLRVKDYTPSDKTVIVTGLLYKMPQGYRAALELEHDLNNTLKNPKDLETYSKEALAQEIAVVLNEENYKGLDLETADRGLKLVWARLAGATNSLTGVLGDNFKIDENHIQADINDLRIFGNIARTAIGNSSYGTK